MLRALVGGLLLLFVGCTTVIEKPVVLADTHEQQFGVLRQATVQIEIMDQEGHMVGSCSGVVVRPHVVLTAAHCDAGDKFEVNGYMAVKVRKDEVKDLMLMYVEKLQASPIRTGSARLDQEVVIIGYPLALAQVLTEGRMMGPISPEVMARIDPEQVERLANYLVVTAPVMFGNSGGPVFALDVDGSYKLIGIVSAMAVAQGMFPVPHLAFIVCTNAINDFLR